jgi:hypothetical protein
VLPEATELVVQGEDALHSSQVVQDDDALLVSQMVQDDDALHRVLFSFRNFKLQKQL